MAKPSAVLLLALLACGAAPWAAASEESCSDVSEDAHLDRTGLGENTTIVCEMGCWDAEDEACHEGLSQNQCAEIYGHVEWAAKCNCRRMDTGEVLSTTIAGSKGSEANIYFSVPAFVVLFRESLEVVIVLVIIVQFLTKAKDDGTISEEMFKRLRREVYVGAGAGFVACLIIGIGFIALASMARGLFKCDSLLVFDGVIMMITASVLTFLALNFYKMIYTKEAHELKMKAQVDAVIAAAQEGQGEAAFGKKHAFLVFAFSTGLREGMESIIFLIGVISDFKDPSYISSLPIPIISALILSRIVGCIFFQGTKKMKVEHFMRFCSVLLLFIAAGFFTSSMHKWQELELFGTWSPLAERPWQNQKVFDATDCCNDKTSRFWVLMRALLGWQDQPTPMEFFAYAFYWVVVGAVGVVIVRRAMKGVEKRMAYLRSTAADQKSADEGLAQETETPETATPPTEEAEAAVTAAPPAETGEQAAV